VTQERLVPLAEEIVLLYEMLETSNVSGKMSKGAVTKVSSKTIEARLQAPVPTASNLRMRLIGSGGKELPELPGTLYGKVVGAAPGTATVLTIRLTSIPPEIKTFLSSLTATAEAPDHAAATSAQTRPEHNGSTRRGEEVG
jgi:hypothetical protein